MANGAPRKRTLKLCCGPNSLPCKQDRDRQKTQRYLMTLRNALLGMKMLRFHLPRRHEARHIPRCCALRNNFRPHELPHRRGRWHDEAEAAGGSTGSKTLNASTRPPRLLPTSTSSNLPIHLSPISRGQQEDVVLHVLPSGMEDFKNHRFHSSQTVEAHPEGGAIVRFRASGMLELAWHLFYWGNKIEIVEPVSLRQQMTTELRVALAHHEEPLRFVYTVDTKKAS